MLRAKCCLNWPDGIPIWKSLNLPIGRILELFFDFLGWWRSQCFFWDFFLVVVITIDMCCAYVRRRRFNEMQQLHPNVTKLVRLFSRYFSISFCFVLFFSVSFFDWVSDWKRIEIYTATSTTSAPGVWRGVWMMMVWWRRPARAKNSWRRPRKNFHFNKSLVKTKNQNQKRKKSGGQNSLEINSWNVVHGPPPAAHRRVVFHRNQKHFFFIQP